MIEFKNVCKRYNTGTEAVKNASFKIEKGEFAFLVGSSNKINFKRRRTNFWKYNNKW